MIDAPNVGFGGRVTIAGTLAVDLRDLAHNAPPSSSGEAAPQHHFGYKLPNAGHTNTVGDVAPSLLEKFPERCMRKHPLSSLSDGLAAKHWYCCCRSTASATGHRGEAHQSTERSTLRGQHILGMTAHSARPVPFRSHHLMIQETSRLASTTLEFGQVQTAIVNQLQVTAASIRDHS
ncbi:hypothetical protein N656DRAFT_547366 [Canariomyces notabilis]|uniref:Uncharacterized protein n=1 Tax=Canariomyces notabilis TaxID=2074819 RepID=A0AAN6THX3_9PEZI|nr:hypothetical protein N656DRAFT_547366 [Canariomyces arenarius]